MDKAFVKREIIETLLWLMQITGIILLVIVGIIYRHKWAFNTGGVLCVVHYTIMAVRSSENRKKALICALIAALIAAILIIRDLTR